jgi:predicted nucleic acid-binding protein
VAVACCDTSFLFSLYGRDTHTPRALGAVTKLGESITLTLFNEFEFLNAVRFAVYRQVLPSEAGASIIAAFEADISAGRLVIERNNLTLVLGEAKRLSSAYSQKSGHRSFDILHVASATTLGAEAFLTFDENQRLLARSAGLKVLPQAKQGKPWN